ncbi:UDP-N-acetyl-D-mannosamine dehydrogenase [Oleidesulfovibrio sp.]|uniref:UDP-N-acetyl-D-mannosamine dehydrogenase n=1 Tax=Oleidesulfovibrio sp. TaxID=2909707 RepID=UPI003A8C7FEE
MQTVCIVGLGYIGLPTASLLATKGFKVHGVDVNEGVVSALKDGRILIYEPSLDIMVKSAVQSGQLVASTTPDVADVFILAVPTPFTDGHKPDLSYVKAASEAIAPYVAPGNLIILESTSPVGTTEKVCEWVASLRPDLVLPCASGLGSGEQVYVAHCPERVLPGKILQELVDNDRVVGGVDVASTRAAEQFYKQFVQGAVLTTTARTAELVKLTENSYRDVNIAFANELSLICEELDVNVWETIKLANHHPRVNILTPGPGVGGHCIAVDPWFIVDSAPSTSKLIHTARKVNEGKPEWVINQVKRKAARFTAPQVACLGLSFKPDIDDLRESPALQIVSELAKDPNLKLFAVEPHVAQLPRKFEHCNNVSLVSLDEALHEADIVVVLVAHRQFKDINQTLLLQRIVIDTCGLLA